MTPWKIQYVLAHGLQIATWGGAVGFICLSLWDLFVYILRHPDGLSILLLIVPVTAAGFLGWILGALALWPLLYWISSRINGAPFREGDMVHILVGPHRGRVVRVYEMWPSRGQARVELGERERVEVTDVFMWNQICLERRGG